MVNPIRIFWLYFLLNILNYLDRNVTSGVLPLIKDHFQATDAALGLLGTAFMVTYSLTAVPFGAWSDRWYPHKVAAVGVAIWSLSTVLSAFAWSVLSLFLFRALVGIGEAAYVTTGSTILSVHFPAEKRSRVLGWFNLGMPIGGAAGVMLGGSLGQNFGWQSAFVLVGIPGLILAFLTWRMPLGRHRNDLPADKGMVQDHAQLRLNRPYLERNALAKLIRNIPFLLTSLGYAGISYAFGAIVFFAPTFFQREFGYTIEHAAFITGVMQVGAGLLGAPIGGILADAWVKRNRLGRVYTLVIGMFLSAIFLFVGLVMHNFLCFFLSTFFMLWHVGVASALVFDVTEPAIWNTAQAAAMLIMHALGDIPSTFLSGWISDQTNLMTSLMLLPIPMVLASVLFLGVGYFLPKPSK